jgi:hypothetical protein
MAVFGWVMLVLILLGGAGALAYVMLFNKKNTATVPAETTGSGSETEKMIEPARTGDEDKDPKKKPGEKDPTNIKDPKTTETKSGSGSGDEPDTGSATTGDDTKTEPKNTTGTKKVGGKTVAVVDDKQTWRQISDAAKIAEKKKDWAGARSAYERLEKAKGYQYPGYAVFKQAEMAYKSNDIADAVTIAQRASALPGNHKPEAKMLYADALAKQGDYKRAKDFYIGLRKTASPAQKKIIDKKISACNAKLGLGAKDGITD